VQTSTMKTTTEASKTILAPVDDHWNLPEGVEKFSEGHIYYANRLGYHKGLTQGVEQEKKEIENRIQNNLILAAADTNKVINALREIGITALSANLKVVSQSSFKVLLTVSNEDFLKEAFLEIYSRVREIQENSKTEVYSTAFTFINKSESFNFELVELDGYAYSYKALE